MEEDDGLVFLTSYLIDELDLIKMDQNGEEITNEVIEREIQMVLKDNMIYYKNRLTDCWFKGDYKIEVEIYVYEIDYLRAQKVLEDYRKDLENAEIVYEDEELINSEDEPIDEEEE